MSRLWKVKNYLISLLFTSSNFQVNVEIFPVILSKLIFHNLCLSKINKKVFITQLSFSPLHYYVFFKRVEYALQVYRSFLEMLKVIALCGKYVWNCGMRTKSPVGTRFLVKHCIVSIILLIFCHPTLCYKSCSSL